MLVNQNSVFFCFLFFSISQFTGKLYFTSTKIKYSGVTRKQFWYALFNLINQYLFPEKEKPAYSI